MSSPSIFLFISLFLLPLLHPSPVMAADKSYTNITLGTTLSPLGPILSWPSPSGDFAFGFRPLEPGNPSSLFLLAIWFARTANQTVAWSANRNNPLSSGSNLSLTTSGELSLRDPNGNEVWNPNVIGISHVAILDTGNLVITSSGSPTQWQSFDKPTDTILPTQVLPSNSRLQSRLDDHDFSDGRFLFGMQPDGNLVFYPFDPSTQHQYSPYWASNTVGAGDHVVFNESSGAIFLVFKNSTLINLTSSASTSTANFYQRSTLDPDGALRQYLHPKNSTSGRWPDSWTAVSYFPSNICGAVTGENGAGVCGYNSYCEPNGNERAQCKCPTQYSFIDPSRKYRGCAPNFVPQSCASPASATDYSLFGFVEMAEINWPLSDYEHYGGFDEDQCRKNCLKDCFCSVMIFHGNNCWKKRLPLSNGRTGDRGGKTLIKVSNTNATEQTQTMITVEGNNKESTLILIGFLALGGSAFLNFLLMLVIIVNRRYKKKNQKLEPGSSISWLNLCIFAYKDLDEATSGFSEVLGSGAFATVYKGVINSEPKIYIAVKKLDKLAKDTEKEFTNEVTAIGRTHHKNLVKLLGFCNEGAHRLLVYEYMTNGSLTNYLLADPPPRWNNRVDIAIGIARGLLYLHEECSSQIIHCDIKPQNILLDENYKARIADFGLAKLLRTNETRTITGIRGTRGYVAPEWFKNKAVTTKVDVYSFGVMLLEIVCCRMNLELEGANDDEAVLQYWAYDCYRDGRIEVLVAGDEEAKADKPRVERFVKVAIWCIQEEPSMRHSMHKVMQMLEGAVEVAVPPDPSSYISSLA